MGAQGHVSVDEGSARDQAVRECLDRILNSPAFRASGRAKQFLSFVVLGTLEGRQEGIKERTIGAEVFGRAADFETSGDSIVRVNANEVRRRLTQYYADMGARDPVRIVLPPGTYVPEFVFPDDFDPDRFEPRPAAPVVLPVETVDHRMPSLRAKPWAGSKLRIAAAGALALAAASLAAWPRKSEMDRFWAPILKPDAAPVLCLPASETFQLTRETIAELNGLGARDFLRLAPHDILRFQNWHTSLPVLQAALSVASVLQRNGRNPLIRIGADLKLDELRGHPVIAIGSFANPWTRQNVDGLRFTFDRGRSDREAPSIRDAKEHGRSWTLSSTFPAPQDRDYAIVTRTFDAVTGAPFVSLAGLHSFGCQAAGEFISAASVWKEMARTAPSGWERMNFQVVLETKVVGTTPSPPKVLDAHFWR